MPIQPGRQLGAYRIEAPLGQGGMGTVYRAFDTTLQRPVAIKVLSEADDQARGKLLAEARATSALDHPNICTVHEVGEADGQPYIVMALVEGKTLSELIPSDGLPPETVIRYGLQIADALVHAHEKGIVHRDLKSQNVVITPEGRAKVLDFGLATRLEQQDAEAVTVSMDTRADMARIAGTLAYMAPEILRGEEATARSDIWALGVLLYEIAAGQLPFGGTTRTDVVSAIVKETPAPLPANVSAGLRNIIQHCLTKEPAQRYRHATAVQAALETIQSDSGSQQAGIPVANRRTWRVAAAVIAAVLIVWIISYWPRPASQTSASGIPRLTDPVQVTRAQRQQAYPRWSPDGQMLAYESNQEGNWDIWVVQPGSAQPVNRTADHPGADRNPSWSPDGSQLAFYSDRDGDRGVFAMSPLGGSARRLGSFGGPEAPSLTRWRPTGDLQWLASGTEVAGKVGAPGWAVQIDREDSGVFVEILTVATGDVRHVTLPGRTINRHQLAWSPDDRYLAYLDTNSPGSQSTQVWVLRVTDGEAVAVTDAVTRNLSPSWSADGRTLYFVSDRSGSLDLWQQPMDDGRPTGEPERVTTGVSMQSAVFSADGTQLAYERGRTVTNLWRLPILDDRESTWADVEQLTFDEAVVEFIDVSPDGNSLLFSSDRAGNSDIWRLPASGGEFQQLTTDPAPDFKPIWSPDGREIAFFSVRSGNRDIWVMPSGGGAPRQVTKHPGPDRDPSWSPDGAEIAFSSPRSGKSEVWLVASGGGEPRQLTDAVAAAFHPVWSPDGAWLTFGGGGRVWLVPPDGGEVEELTQGSNARWSPDGRQVYFTSSRSGQNEVWVLSLVDRSERQVTNTSGRPGNLGSNSLATDGHSYVYFSSYVNESDIWVMDVVQDEP